LGPNRKAETTARQAAGQSEIDMSWQVQIVRAKPNPVGKDKAGDYPRPEQLLGEWVDLKNVGDAAVALNQLYLARTEHDRNGVPHQKPTIYWNGLATEILLPNQAVRVHTGRSRDAWLMNSTDAAGVDRHAFADKGSFVLSNRFETSISIWWKAQNQGFQFEDRATYDSEPPEGAVLVRVGTKLQAASSSYVSYYR
jgi:hypothetical protein